MNTPLALQDQSRIEDQILRTAQKFKGSSLLDQLRSYYFTWHLPDHPDSDELYQWVLWLVQCRKEIDLFLDRDSSLMQKMPQCLKRFQLIFDPMNGLGERDTAILDHCKMHYFCLNLLVKTRESIGL